MCEHEISATQVFNLEHGGTIAVTVTAHVGNKDGAEDSRVHLNVCLGD